MLVRFDNALLHWADATILWLWNTFSIRRISVLRALLMTFIAGYGGLMIYANTLTTFIIIIFAVLLVAFAHEEYLNGKQSPETRNLTKLLAREMTFSRTIRLASVAMFFLNALLNLTDPVVIFWVVLFIFVVLEDSLTPTDPPKRKEPETQAVPELN